MNVQKLHSVTEDSRCLHTGYSPYHTAALHSQFNSLNRPFLKSAQGTRHAAVNEFKDVPCSWTHLHAQPACELLQPTRTQHTMRGHGDEGNPARSRLDFHRRILAPAGSLQSTRRHHSSIPKANESLITCRARPCLRPIYVHRPRGAMSNHGS